MDRNTKTECLKIAILGWLTLVTALSGADDQSPFRIRGVKGLCWQGIENYKSIVRWLPDHHFNFLMFCYTSFPGSAGDWRKPYSDAELRGMKEVAEFGRDHGITICLSVNPGISSKPPLQYGSEQELDILVKKFLSVHEVGVGWFALCLDDISTKLQPEDEQRFKTLAAAQSHFVNQVFNRLRQADPAIELIFCPSAYTTGAAKAAMDYITYVGEHIDQSVKFFWTGPACCSPSITEEDADYFASLIKRKPLIWDNYPVNDYASWRLILGPLRRRSPGLGEHVLGLMSNPMKQAEASKLPLATIGDYLGNPTGYDPDASMDRAIKEMGRGMIDGALRQLMDIYGNKFLGDPGFVQLSQIRTIEEAKATIARLEGVLSEIAKHGDFKPLYEDIKEPIERDIKTLRSRIRSLESSHAPPLTGLDFRGGAAERFGYAMHNREDVNYVYAKSTPCSTMTARFLMPKMEEGKKYELVIEACDDDYEAKCAIEILLNGKQIFQGKSEFPNAHWATKSFPVPEGAIKEGENTIEVRCIEPEGRLGMPPWFMVSKVDLRS